MKAPTEVAAMLKLHELGWCKKSIARELGVIKTTVGRYLAAGGILYYARPERRSLLEGQEECLAQELSKHRGNADVVRQELERQKGIVVSLRTMERAVRGRRNGCWWGREARCASGGCRGQAAPPLLAAHLRPEVCKALIQLW